MSELTWDDIVPMLRGYGAFYEVGDITLSPWPDDPDGGEIRLVGALRGVAEWAAGLGPDAAMSTESIRRMLADRLARDRPTVTVERRDVERRDE